MKIKLISFCILFFLVFSSLFFVVFKTKAYTLEIDSFREKFFFDNTFSKNLDYLEADLILDELLMVEQNFTGLTKIEKQINIFQKHAIISDSFTIDDIYDSFNFLKFFRFGFKSFLGGPYLVSHLTLNGRINGLVPFWEPMFYINIFNGSKLHGVGGFLPLYMGYSINPVYITGFDFSNSEFFGQFYFRFFEFMVPCVGFSLAFYGSDNSSVLFEYNLDFCLFGLFGGF